MEVTNLMLVNLTLDTVKEDFNKFLYLFSKEIKKLIQNIYNNNSNYYNYYNYE
jgi:uncharacterized protein YqfB (UPF0267 family)